MAYTPHEWTNGETVTASKLNHMEDGIVNGGGILNIDLEIIEDFSPSIPSRTVSNSFDATITSHTWQEIYNAIEDGNIVVSNYYYYEDDDYYSYDTMLLTGIGYEVGFYIELIDLKQRDTVTFYASDPNDYPTTLEPSSAEEK